MTSAFSPDSKFSQLLSLLADVVIVSLALFITTIPVVTFGAGLSAAYYITGQLVRDEGARRWRTFWAVFAASFRVATPGWLLVCAALGLGGYEFALLNSAQSTWLFADGIYFDALRIGLLMACVIVGAFSIWFFALVGHASRLARQRLTFGGACMCALNLAFRHLFYTLVLLALWGIVIGASFVWPQLGVRLIFFYIVFIPGFIMYLSSFVLSPRILSALP
ncbi:MAG: hypothetical protein PUK40_04875 [Actinomycetaceae bacterium]|nr:hypothetical protein [Arcanobacterium sp.]MDD7505267.1 hypothetical protein [Actinomycetaceae bacterium]MDY6144030.1 hypothetical protein [Arcanobacterium sp.]